MPCPNGFRIAPRLPRTDVEFPAVPGAANEFSGTRQTILPGHAGLRQADNRAAAQFGTLVRTSIGERKEFAGDIEEADLTYARASNLAADERDFAGAGYNLPAHCRP